MKRRVTLARGFSGGPLVLLFLAGCVYFVPRDERAKRYFELAQDQKLKGKAVEAARLYQKAERLQRENRENWIATQDALYSRRVVRRESRSVRDFDFQPGEVDLAAIRSAWGARSTLSDFFLKLLNIGPQQVDQLKEGEIFWALHAALQRPDLAESVPQPTAASHQIPRGRTEARNRYLLQAAYPEALRHSRIVADDERFVETRQAPPVKIIFEGIHAEDR